MNKIRTAAVYIRVSTDMQMEQSPESQLVEIQRYAAQNNILIQKEYIFMEQEGRSGRKAGNRMQFQNMIATAKATPKPFDCILVWKFSRFARNQEESIVYKSLLKKAAVDVLSVSEPLADGPFGSLIERIIEWMDEYYSIRLSGEVTRGMTEKALRGGYQARPPLGYKITERGKPPVIVPEEAEIVRLIFHLYVNERKSFFDIARYLNQNGYKTSRNKNFEVRSIDYIIKNPTYCGMIRWNRTTNETNEIKDESEWIITEGHHEAIIDKETFDKAQEIFKATFKPRGARPSSTYKHWLSGLLKCPICGRTMIAKTMHKKSNGDYYAYFECYGFSKGKCLGNNRASSLTLAPSVIEALRKALDTQDIIYTLVKKQQLEPIDHTAVLENQLAQLKQKEKRIKDAYRDGIDTLEEYKDNKLILQKEREELEKQLANQAATIPAADTKDLLIKNIRNVYEMVVSDQFTDQQKNEALKTIIEKIIYDKKNDTLKVYYYLVEP